MSFKIGAFKNCVIFTGSTYVGVCFPMNIAKFLRTSVFYRAPFVATDFFIKEKLLSVSQGTVFISTTFFIESLWKLLFKVMFETCLNFTMKNQKL